jgi:hypothetical protein
MRVVNRTPADIEQQVMTLSREGVSGEQIARDLGIGETTVRRIRHRCAQVDFVSLAQTRQARIEAGFQKPPGERAEDFFAADVPNVPVSDKPFRVLAIGDAHDDIGLDKKRFGWFGKHAVEMQPDHIVQIGDICDLESLSFHSPNDTNNGKFKPRFVADIGSLRKALDAMFTPMSKAGVKARFDVTLGNHENRIWRYEDSAPETVGMLQGEFFKLMTEHNVYAHAYGKYISLAGVKFTHAPFSVMGKPIGGATATQTVARQSSGDICFGHSHKANVVTSPRLGGEDKVTIIDLGCALPQGYVMSYAKHTLVGWSYGIWELIIQHGSIQGYNFIPMAELERRYGK